MSRPYRTIAGGTALVLLMLLGVWLLITLRTFVVLVAVAALLAAALDQPVNAVQRRLHLKRRGYAVALVMVVSLVLIGVFAYLAVSPLAHQSASLRRGLPARVESIRKLPLIGSHLRHVDLRGETQRFLKEFPHMLTARRNVLIGVATSAVNWLLLAITVVAVAIFMLLNGPGMAESASAQILNDLRRVRAKRLAANVLEAVGGYVRGNLLISLMAAGVTAVALISMGIPFVAVLAVLMFLLDLIPMVGATLGGVVVTAATFILDPQPWKALVFVVIYALYQLVETHTIYPVVMGRTVKIGAFSVFLVTLAGGELAGILGALLAIPTGAALNVLVKDLLEERRGKLAAEPPPSRLELISSSEPPEF